VHVVIVIGKLSNFILYFKSFAFPFKLIPLWRYNGHEKKNPIARKGDEMTQKDKRGESKKKKKYQWDIRAPRMTLSILLERCQWDESINTMKSQLWSRW
jgi:hypothetical protein